MRNACVLAVLLVLGPGAGLRAQETGPDARPENRGARNLVFILVDDLGWTDLRSFGSSFYDTPHLDRLAASGMRFTDAYASCPVCSPTRAAILTGRYPTRTGITDYIDPGGGNQPERWKRATKLLPAKYEDRLALEEQTLAEDLSAAGYATFFAGKWHLGPEGHYPEDQGFDINRGGLERGGPYGGKKYFSPYGNKRLEDGPDGEHLPDRLARETVRFIEASRERPFLAYLSFYSVHTPLMAREDLRAKYEARREALHEASSKPLEIWGGEGERRVRRVQEHAVYAGMVEAMDLAVGRVLDALERLKLEKDTVVVFTSDNGGLSTSEGHPTSNLPLRAGKGWLYEGGVRVPLLVRWPGVTRPGAVSSHVVTSVDYLPTLREIFGVPVRADEVLDGRSFVPALRGEVEERGTIYWHYPHYGNQGGAPGSALREGRWKLIEWFEGPRVELFDLTEDIGEREDLAASRPELRDRLLAKLKRFREETRAKMPSAR